MINHSIRVFFQGVVLLQSMPRGYKRRNSDQEVQVQKL